MYIAADSYSQPGMRFSGLISETFALHCVAEWQPLAGWDCCLCFSLCWAGCWQGD